MTEPGHRAGHTDAEWERNGDAVLVAWRDWIQLRERIAEEKMGLYEQPKMHVDAHEKSAGRRVYDEIMQMMDEWPV